MRYCDEDANDGNRDHHQAGYRKGEAYARSAGIALRRWSCREISRTAAALKQNAHLNSKAASSLVLEGAPYGLFGRALNVVGNRLLPNIAAAATQYPGCDSVRSIIHLCQQRQGEPVKPGAFY